MKRREFVTRVSAGLVAVAPGLPRWPVRGRAAPWLLVPMDDSQSDHLKAYGLAFRLVARGGKAEWFLNYRGGAFLLPADGATSRDAALAGVTTEPLDDGRLVEVRGEIQNGNMDAVPLEKAPEVAVYAPPNAAPWDDAVTMALNYAGIKFEKIWDPEVARDGLRKYDWLHLHHEDFTGQYSKFFLNYAGAPWLMEMVEQNRDHGTRSLGYPSVPAEKRAVAARDRPVRGARRIPVRDVHRDRDARPGAGGRRRGHRRRVRRRHVRWTPTPRPECGGIGRWRFGTPGSSSARRCRSTPTSTATR